MLDFYFIPDSEPSKDDPAGMACAGSLTLQQFGAMTHVSEGLGTTLPISYFDDQRFTHAEVGGMLALLSEVAENQAAGNTGNSAFEAILAVLREAAGADMGLQTFAD